MRAGWFLAGALGIAAIGWFAPPQPLLDRWQSRYCDCPGPLKVAQSTMTEARRERQLLVSSISFDSRAVTEEPLLIPRPEGVPDLLWDLVSTSKTILAPTRVDYVVDLEAMTEADLGWDEASQTLSIRRPPVTLRKPQLLGGAKVEVRNGFVLWVSGAEEKLTETALGALVANAESAARGEKPMAKANDDADRALARTFEVPLRAAGHGKVRVVVTRP
jgi:hypothetical protein